MNSLSDLLRRFLRSERGNIAMMFAISLVPICIATGVGLDFARAAVVRNAMSEALDAAALAVGSTGGLNQSTAQALAQKYFNANYKVDASYGSPTIYIGANDYNSSGSVTVTAVDNMPATLLKVAGYTTVPVTASTTVVWGQTRLWVALVLDNSGSMSQGDYNGSKMTALKNASHQLLTTLQNASSNAGDVQVSIVPFDRSVNVGTANVNASWIDWTDWEAPPPNVSLASSVGPGSACPFTTTNGWGQTVQQSPYGFSCTSGSANGSSTVNTIPSSGMICPGIDSGNYNTDHRDRYYNGCWTSTPSTTVTTGSPTVTTFCSGSNTCKNNPKCNSYPTTSTTTSGNSTTVTTTTCNCNSSGGTRSCKTTATPVTTTLGAPYSHTWTINDHSTWSGCVMDRDKTHDYDISNVAPNGNSKGFPAVNPQSCVPATVTPLGYDWSALGSQIDAMNPNSSTNQAIGVAHGWQTLTNSAPYSPGALPSNTSRFIILLSDGLNTQDRWWGDGSTEKTTEDGYIDAREKAACDAAKADGITIYTIFLDIGGSDGYSAPLQYCASDSSKYFDLTSTTAVVSTFSAIATQITALRISH